MDPHIFARVNIVCSDDRYTKFKIYIPELISDSYEYNIRNNALHFFLNNQPDTLTIQIYSVIKRYMFRASSLPIIRSFQQKMQCII